jgi:hypothetical protein
MTLVKNLKDKYLFLTNIILVLLILNLFSINLAKLSFDISFIFSIYLLIILFFINFPFKRFSTNIMKAPRSYINYNQFFFGLFSIVLSIIFLFLTKKQMIWLASTSLFVSGLYITLYSFEIKRKELAILFIASFFYSLFFLFVQSVHSIWFLMQRFSIFFSGFSGSIIGKTVVLGPSISGLWLIFIFVILFICIFLVSNSKNKIKFILNIIGLFTCWIIYIITVSVIGFESKINADDFIFLLFLLCLIPTFYYLRQCKFKSSLLEIPIFEKIKLKKIVKNTGFLGFIAIIISVLFLTTFYPVNNIDTQETTHILFYNKNQLVDWNTPKYTALFQNIQTGMLGLLPFYLNSTGYKTSMLVEDKDFFNDALYDYNANGRYIVNLSEHISVFESEMITSETLENIDILVVINLQKSFTEKEKKIIWDFVQKGGSLLVLGDHTDVAGIQEPLNDLLSPVGISYRFDTSIPMNEDVTDWFSCYHLMHHPICHNIENEFEIQIDLGASLNVTMSSFPIIIGRYALSDKGDYLNASMGNIGNFKYDSDEQIGDIVLVAAAYYGKGKVVAFGDTNTFLNSKISYTNPLVRNTFNWLRSNDAGNLRKIQIVLALISLLFMFIVFFKFHKKFLYFHFLIIGLCIAVLVSTSINSPVLFEPCHESKIAYINTSNIERFSIKTSADDSINEMIYHISANGYLPVIKNDFSNINFVDNSIILFNAPTKTFSEKQVSSLKNYMHEGSLVILAAGYEDKTASMPLLEELYLDIKDIPLGQVNYNPSFLDIVFVDAWPIEILDYNNTEVFYSFKSERLGYNYSTIVFKGYGKGGLLLISDSQFLLNENLKSYGNSRFITIIFDALYERGLLK